MKTRIEITEDDHGHISITGSQGDENAPLDPSAILGWLELAVAAMEALIEHEAREGKKQ